MRSIKFIVIILVIITTCASCSNPQSVAFVINTTNQTITLYSETDSVSLYPLQKTYLCDIIVDNGDFIAYTGSTWTFNIFEPIEKIRLQETTYNIGEEHRMFLADITNYTHYTSIVNINPSIAKLEGSNYEFYLTADFVNEIINASEKE